MEKLVYLVWPESLDAAAATTSLLGKVAKHLLETEVRALNISVNDLAEQIGGRGISMGEGPKLLASVSIWVDSIDARAPLEAMLREVGRIDGYLVTESVPQPCSDRNWQDGTRSPGVSHVTWFPKPNRLTDAQFLHGWQEEHTPLSFDLHPLRWEYVRNSVARVLTEGSPKLAAIVVERFRTLEDYTDPERLYGGKEVLAKMVEELPNFADVSDMHSTPLSETIFRTL